MSRRIYAKKSLGQNFLVDKQIKTKIINNLYLNKDDKIIEVGPGKGALTEMIYEKVSSLLAIELDDNLYLNLSSKYESENVNIIKADAKLFKIVFSLSKSFSNFLCIPYVALLHNLLL